MKHNVLKTLNLFCIGAMASVLFACGGSGTEEEAKPIKLTVTVNGSGVVKTLSGTVNCGDGAVDCAQDYMEVTTEQFKAVPNQGYYFSGWEVSKCRGVDAQCELELSTDLSDVSDGILTMQADFKPLDQPQAATYTHNAQGQRTSKTVGGVTTYFIYDLDGHLISELDASGNPVKETLYLDGQAIAQMDKALSGTTYDAIHYVHTDHLGSPVMMTDGVRDVVWEIETTPFGVPYALYEESDAQNMRFPGQYYDEESNLYYNWNRTYDSSIGRYLQSDPIGLGGGINTYVYVYGNPVVFYDPYGLWAFGDPLPQWLVDGSAGFGNTLSFGITSQINDALGHSVDRCSDAYRYGGYAGVGVSLAFGGAHLGRNAIYQSSARGGLTQGLNRLVKDDRTWGAVRSQWSRRAGNGVAVLKQRGQQLHHWYKAQSRGGSNAGFNYLPVSNVTNRVMGNGRQNINQFLTFNAFRGVTLGIYGAPVTNGVTNLRSNSNRSCGC